MVSDAENDQPEKVTAKSRGALSEAAREDRRKAALKANLARRKAQARAKATGTAPVARDRSDNEKR
jgi:hypothetical protein